MLMSRILLFVAALLCGSAVCVRAADVPPPLTQNGGNWPTSHVQGIAVDLKGGYIYYSFTRLLVKYDFHGRLVGSIGGFTGHLGDLDFNPADGCVYGSLEYKKDQAFYIAVIDVSKLNEVGLDAAKSEIFRTVYLPLIPACRTIPSTSETCRSRVSLLIPRRSATARMTILAIPSLARKTLPGLLAPMA